MYFLSKHQIKKNKNTQFPQNYKAAQLFSTLLILRNVSCAANISILNDFRSCDTEEWSNDAENSSLTYRDELHLKIYSNRKTIRIINCNNIFTVHKFSLVMHKRKYPKILPPLNLSAVMLMTSILCNMINLINVTQTVMTFPGSGFLCDLCTYTDSRVPAAAVLHQSRSSWHRHLLTGTLPVSPLGIDQVPHTPNRLNEPIKKSLQQ